MVQAPHLDWRIFDSVFLINLADRKDRRRSLEMELASVGLHAPNPRLCWIDAKRPADAGPFESIGARGCFLSHLECLESACDRNLSSILILEDDAHFPRSKHMQLGTTLVNLQQLAWDVWYGGHRIVDSDIPLPSDVELYQVSHATRVDTAHCIAFCGPTIPSIRNFLRLILTRPPGHPEAGPMHVDGAYNAWRRLTPASRTLLSNPPVCSQRASRSDIASRRWFDSTPLIRETASLMRDWREIIKRRSR